MRRLLQWLAGLLGGGLLLLAVLFIFRQAILAPYINSLLVEQARIRLGLDFSIGTVGGTYLTGLELTGVRTTGGAPTTPLTEVEFDRLALHYSLPALLAGVDSFLGKTRIELNNARVQLDFPSEEAKPARPDLAGKIGVVLPARLPQIVIKNSAIRIHTSAGVVAFRGLAATSEPALPGQGGEAQPVAINAEQVTLPWSGFTPGPHTIAVRLRYGPAALSVDGIDIDAETVVKTAEVDLQDLQKQRISLAADLELFGGLSHLQALVDPAKAGFSGRLTLNCDDLGAFPSFLQQPEKEVAGKAAGLIDFTLDPNDPARSLRGSLKLRIHEGRLGNSTIPQASLDASASNGIIRVQRLALGMDNGTLTLKDGAVPIRAIANSDPTALINNTIGSFSLSVSDIDPLLDLASISLPRLTGAVRPALALQAEGALDRGSCRLTRLEASTSENILRLTDVSLPLAEVLFGPGPYRFLAATTGNFFIEAKKVRDLLALTGHDIPPSLQQIVIPVHDLSLAGRMDAGTIIVSRGELHAGGAAVVLKQGGFTLPLPDFSFEKIAMQADLALAIPDLSELTTIFGLPRQYGAGSLHGNIKINGPLASLNGDMDLKGEQLVLGNVLLDVLAVRARAAAGLITLDSLEAAAGADRLQGSGSFDISSQCFKDLNLQVSVTDVARYLGDAVAEELRLSGRLQARLQATGPWDHPEARLQAVLADGDYRSVAIREATFTLVSAGRLLTIETARLNTAAGEMTLTGTLHLDPGSQQDDFTLDSLKITSEQAELTLQQPAELVFDHTGSLAIKDFKVAGNIGRIEANGLLAFTGNSDLRLHFAGLTSTGWLQAWTDDRLYFDAADFSVDLQGSLRAPVISLQGAVAEIGGRNAPFPFSGSFALTWTQTELRLQKFQWAGKGGQSSIDISGNLPGGLVFGRAQPSDPILLNGLLDLPDLRLISKMLPEQYRASGSMNGDFSLQGTLGKPTGRLRLAAANLMAPPALKFLPPGPFTLVCDLTAAADRYSFPTLQIKGTSQAFDLSGDWLNPPSPFGVLRDRAALRSGTLDLTGSLTMSDLSWVARKVEAVRKLAGELTAQAFVSGPASGPQISGTFRLSGGDIRTSYEIPSIRGIDMDGAFDSGRLSITNLRGELGGAPFALTGEIKDIMSETPELDLALRGENLLLLRSEGVKLRSDADLRASGPLDRLTVSGELAVTDGRFTKNFDFFNLLKGTERPKSTTTMELFSFHEPPLQRAVLQVRIVAKKPFKIRNNLADGAARPDILLTGTGEVPVLTGNIYLEPTKLKLPSGVVNMETGLIRFPETDPDRPQLDLTGTARLMGYDVTVMIHGPADEPVITLSSSPPLPDDQLLLLVLAAKPPETAAESTAAGRAMLKSGMNVAVYLGRSILNKWFSSSSADSDESILERFELEIGRGVTRLGDETIDAQFRLAEGVFRDDDILFITAEKDIYDTYNTGVKLVFQFR